jgi:hypothetical protein
MLVPYLLQPGVIHAPDQMVKVMSFRLCRDTPKLERRADVHHSQRLDVETGLAGV